jgi:CheY-like chemotaxis protein
MTTLLSRAIFWQNAIARGEVFYGYIWNKNYRSKLRGRLFSSKDDREYPSVMTRVLVVDDQEEFRLQLCSVLAYSGLEVVGEVGSIREALELLPGLSADLALVDVEMPEINGLDGTMLLKRITPGLRVILISAYADQVELLAKAAARVGAESFVSKDCIDTEVVLTWKRHGELE